MRKSNFALRLQPALLEEARKLAQAVRRTKHAAFPKLRAQPCPDPPLGGRRAPSSEFANHKTAAGL